MIKASQQNISTIIGAGAKRSITPALFGRNNHCVVSWTGISIFTPATTSSPSNTGEWPKPTCSWAWEH